VGHPRRRRPRRRGARAPGVDPEGSQVSPSRVHRVHGSQRSGAETRGSQGGRARAWTPGQGVSFGRWHTQAGAVERPLMPAPPPALEPSPSASRLPARPDRGRHARRARRAVDHRDIDPAGAHRPLADRRNELSVARREVRWSSGRISWTPVSLRRPGAAVSSGSTPLILRGPPPSRRWGRRDLGRPGNKPFPGRRRRAFPRGRRRHESDSRSAVRTRRDGRVDLPRPLARGADAPARDRPVRRGDRPGKAHRAARPRAGADRPGGAGHGPADPPGRYRHDPLVGAFLVPVGVGRLGCRPSPAFSLRADRTHGAPPGTQAVRTLWPPGTPTIGQFDWAKGLVDPTPSAVGRSGPSEIAPSGGGAWPVGATTWPSSGSPPRSRPLRPPRHCSDSGRSAHASGAGSPRIVRRERRGGYRRSRVGSHGHRVPWPRPRTTTRCSGTSGTAVAHHAGRGPSSQSMSPCRRLPSSLPSPRNRSSCPCSSTRSRSSSACSSRA
jgi:hypothetical protein